MEYDDSSDYSEEDMEFQELDYPVGTKVVIAGIRSQPILNGLKATVDRYIPDKPDRVGILVERLNKVISVKKENIVLDEEELEHLREESMESVEMKPPKLLKKMSNSERDMDFAGNYHVNEKIKNRVNLATPGRPDHTFSAVGFNIHAIPTGNVIYVRGFAVGGELSRVRVFICPGESCFDHREDIRKWACIYDKKHKAAWERNADILFEEPIIIAPAQTCAFYIHSDRDDDLGLKYRSCSTGVVHEDGKIAITRGFAHTSPVPFDPNHGWFRENRVLSGTLYYDAVPIRWSNFSHDEFPINFQHAVVVLRHMLEEEQDWHEYIVRTIIEFLPVHWFGLDEEPQEFLSKLNAKLKPARHSHQYGWWQ